MRATATGFGNIALWLLPFALAGCVAPKGSDPTNPAVSVQTARAADVQQRRMVPVNSFSSRDRIAVVIRNLTSHEQVLQLELARQDTGMTLWKNAITIPRARSYATGPTAPLPAGKYTVKASGTGIQPVIHGFAVYGY
jgi:hypothetical protein